MNIPLPLRSLLASIPGVMALRRRQLMVRYEPLSALWDGGHLCPVLGIPKLSGSWFEIGRGIADIGGSNKFAAEVVAVIQRSKPEHRVAMFEQARRAFDHARRFIPGIGARLSEQPN